MKKRYIALIVVAVVLVLVIVFFAQATTIYSTQVVAAKEGGQLGIAPFTDRVDFGDVPIGTQINKTVTLTNEGGNANNIKVFIMGGIGDFLEVEPRSFTLEPGEEQDIIFTISIPASAEPGHKFSGRIIILKLPKSLW